MSDELFCYYNSEFVFFCKMGNEFVEVYLFVVGYLKFGMEVEYDLYVGCMV